MEQRTGSAAVSLANGGYGASVTILVDLDDTLAFVGDDASITALGNKDVGVRNGVHDGDGNQGTQVVRGFALTMISIWLVPLRVARAGGRWAFAALAVGPALGVLAMGRLRLVPEAVKMAGGRR